MLSGKTVIFLDFFKNQPLEAGMLIIALLLAFSFLLYQIIFFRRRGRLITDMNNTHVLLGPKEWEREMINLSLVHGDVKWMKRNFMVSNYNQNAYKKLNMIRYNIAEVSSDIISLVPSARWLFDNFQMMYREIKKVKTTGTSYEMLPILQSGIHRGYPRVYIIAKKMVILSGGYISEENISLMIKAYQQERPLTDKELWVLPEMIGLCILERIIEVSDDIVSRIRVKNKADKFVKDMLRGHETNPDITPLLIRVPGGCSENASFHSHVIYLLKNMSFEDEAIQRYITFHCKDEVKHPNPADVFKEEGRIESSLESDIRTLIVSLREINQLDEEKLFESLSIVESILSNDPEEIYPYMDSEGRGMYRQVIEKMSFKYGLLEKDIAEACLEMAKNGRKGLNRSGHVGTYLIGKGYPILKAKMLGKSVPREIKKSPNLKGYLYTLTIGIVTVFLYAFMAFIIMGPGEIKSNGILFFFLLISTPILIGIASEVANNIFTRIIAVKKIPALDYIKSIPETARTFMVMPVILSSKEQGIDYVDRLHKHYLANRQSNIYFALLVDYKDYSEKHHEEDEHIKNALIGKIEELNEMYPSEYKRFCLFIRDRIWNDCEDCYMGWERKRGKLEEFNYILCGHDKEKTSFNTIVCDEEIITTFSYVITLDADSHLIRDNAAKLVGMMDHPLNKAVLDEKGKKIKEGYAIIQPCVRNHIIDSKSSAFHKIVGGQTGIVNYSSIVSDVYQDIFQEGTYIGKGIYNVSVFCSIFEGEIPENTVLSHDLLESCYARTAFASTVNIMDDFPATVLSFTKREHRWIRGDWQLLPWLFKHKTLSRVSRWKILENLRRSIVPLSKTFFIVLNLALLPEVFYLWIPIVLFSDILNLVILILGTIAHKINRPKMAIAYRKLHTDLKEMNVRALLELILTPYKAYVATDAAVRTIYRMFVSKKNLLMWNPSENVEKSIQNTQKGYFLHMWMTIIPAVIVIVLLFVHMIHPYGTLLYAALALTWAFSYKIAYHISQPKARSTEHDYLEGEILLEETARRTWRFFRDFSTKENHWLCPDNYQITNKEKITSKTSPTNIGLQVLSVMSARDLGLETLSNTLDMLKNIVNTLDNLEKWNGHLYNWYNIKTLEILHPQYISTVDSGNFFAHLITLKNGIKEQKNLPLISEKFLHELREEIRLGNADIKINTSYDTVGELKEDLINAIEALCSMENKPWEDAHMLVELSKRLNNLKAEIENLGEDALALPFKITLREMAHKGNKYAELLEERIEGICDIIESMFEEVEFKPLYNKKRRLFHIGYHVNSQTIDEGCYDLIASESLLTSFLTIAKGEIPVKHWYKLGRPLTTVSGIPSFVSWSGTMFEYLMPNLVLRDFEGSVFNETCKGAIIQHIKYGKKYNMPWGISESQYYRFDLDSNYQYKAFGVPELRLQPSLSNSLVVAPYATVLALDYSTKEALINLKRMKGLGAFGKYGFYEAMDFNGPDPINATPFCIVKSFMAHHQGMNLVAINNFLNDGIMKKRFHEEPMIKATEVLLEEKRQSYFISISKRGYTVNLKKIEIEEEDILSKRYIKQVSTKTPAVNYLSNNKYSLMITSDGDGFSNYMGTMIYRWRSDLYANTGNYIYVKDVSDNKLWSTTYHPTKAEPDEYEAIFSPHEAEFRRRDGDISTYTIVSLAPSENIEFRKVTLTNHSKMDKHIELTSYMEVVGDRYLAELSHPAFNKLFIESEYIAEDGVFVSKRRGKEGDSSCIIHMVKSTVRKLKNTEYENDRLRFIGRNNTAENPVAVTDSIPLSNNAGFSNDPIMSIRESIIIGAEQTVSLTFITGICENREEAMRISNEFAVEYRIDDLIEKFRHQCEMELKYLNITRQQVNAFQDLISPIYYPSRSYRGPVENIRRNWKNQSFLWRFGVSGDSPVMLLRVNSIEEAGIIKDVLKAYEYFRVNQVKVDLIILSEAKHGYMQELNDLLNDMISSLKIYDEEREKPSLFIIPSYQMNPAEIDLLFTVSRVVFSEKTGVYFRSVKEINKEVKAE